MFDTMACKSGLFVSHILLITKKKLFCTGNETKPSIIVWNSRIKMIHRLEMMVANSCNKCDIHFEKWGK